MKSSSPVAVFWFRRDLRLEDNRGLFEALTSGAPVLPIFIFDESILARLKDTSDARVTFIHRALTELDRQIREAGSSLFTFYGKPDDVFEKILKKFDVQVVFTNHDYEPYARERDAKIQKLLAKHEVELLTFKDQVIFEKSEVTKDDGKPYTVFSAYAKKWLKTFEPKDAAAFPSEDDVAEFYQTDEGKLLSLKEIGFKESEIEVPEVSPELDKKLIANYLKTRDLPALRGTSRLGVHLRFGTVSIRRLVREARKASEQTWLKELIWREFFMQILWHFPHVVKGAFRPEYDKVPYREDRSDWKAWTEGKTGYAIVDAGMRELNATGFMHNRVRMIAASFLVKQLLISWQDGERYFAEKLLDFELASNNGNWQWVAGSGCDSAPYFRVFNPLLQQKRFDKSAEYIKKWVPEYGTDKEIEPMIDPMTARVRVLRAYKQALNRKAPKV